MTFLIVRRGSPSRKRNWRGGRRRRWGATMGCHWRREIPGGWRLCRMLMWRSRLGLFTKSLVTRNRDLCMEWEALCGSVEYHGTLGFQALLYYKIWLGAERSIQKGFCGTLWCAEKLVMCKWQSCSDASDCSRSHESHLPRVTRSRYGYGRHPHMTARSCPFQPNIPSRSHSSSA